MLCNYAWWRWCMMMYDVRCNMYGDDDEWFCIMVYDKDDGWWTMMMTVMMYNDVWCKMYDDDDRADVCTIMVMYGVWLWCTLMMYDDDVW